MDDPPFGGIQFAEGERAAILANVVRGEVGHRPKLCLPGLAESLGIDELTPGLQFGLAVGVNDGDEATPGQKGWSGLGPHALVFGKTPSETAQVTLIPEPGSLGLFMTAIIGVLLRRRQKGERPQK